MVSVSDIGHYRDIATVETGPLTQDAATRRFEYRGIDIRVAQDIARTFRAAAVARVDAPALDIDAVCARHADTMAAAVKDMGN